MSSSIVFEFRSSGTGSMVNGGGFKTGASGTDYSQQDAAQWTAADGTSTASTTFISLTSTFTSAIVGNVLHITAGTGATVGWYEVTGYTDANTVTLDRVSGTYTAATFYVGGALSLNSTLDDDFFEEISGANTTDGVKVWFKNGSFTLGEAVSIAGAGGTQAPIVVEGYNATRGDTPTGTSRPTITGAANSFALGTNWDIYNIIFTGTATSVLSITASDKVINCKITNTSTIVRSALIFASNNTFIYNVEAISYRGTAIATTGNVSARVFNSYLHDSNVGFSSNATTPASHISGNIISDNVNSAINFSTAVTGDTNISNNTIYGAENKLGTGVVLITGSTNAKIFNNIIYGFVTGVSHADVQSVGFDNYNDYNNNNTDVTNWTKGANDVTTAPGFTSVAQLTGTTATTSGSVLTQSGGDFSTVTDNVDFLYLVSGTGITAGKYKITSHTATTVTLDIAPGTNATADKVWQITTGHNFAIGTNLKALGFPGAFQGGTTTGYTDIGATQRQEAGGSSVTVGYSYGN